MESQLRLRVVLPNAHNRSLKILFDDPKHFLSFYFSNKSYFLRYGFIPIIKAKHQSHKNIHNNQSSPWGFQDTPTPHEECGYLFLLERGVWEETLQEEEDETVELEEVLLTTSFFSGDEVWPSGAGGVGPASLPGESGISKEAARIKVGKVTFIDNILGCYLGCV